MRARKEALYEAAERVADAVADACGLSRDDVRDSGVFIRILSGSVSDDGRLVIVTGLEVMYRRCVPTLDERVLATALGLRVVRSDAETLRLERPADLARLVTKSPA